MLQLTETAIEFSKKWTIADLVQIGKEPLIIETSHEDLKKVNASYETMLELVREGRWIYGVSSGFGPLATEDASTNVDRQERLIYHLATGVGPKLDAKITRMVFALRLKQLSQGFSGISPTTYESLVEAFNQGFLPEVPAMGSVGASGDLTPLAHLALGLKGQSNFYINDQYYEASDFKSVVRFPEINWIGKDALAFVNGTAVMTSITALNSSEVGILFRLSCQLAYSYGECLGAYPEAWSSKLAELHPQRGHLKNVGMVD